MEEQINVSLSLKSISKKKKNPLYLQKLEVCQIWPVGYNLLIPDLEKTRDSYISTRKIQ